MDIILVRHGETAWNAEEVFRGRIDIELNETGVRQAQLLAGYLSGAGIEAVLSSPLKRALKTAEAIAARHNLEVEVIHGLIDLDFGEWQGLTHPEVREKYSELYRKWVDNPDSLVFPGGESLDDVKKRAAGVVDEVISKYRSAVVLVSHRVVNKVIICALLGLDNSHFWNIRQDTCGVTAFSYESGRFVLAAHNDTSFLKNLHTEKLSDF